MRLAGVAARMELKAAQLLVDGQSRLFSDTIWRDPSSVVWTNMVMPTELFYAAGLTPVHMELAAGWMSTLGIASEQIAAAHASGFPVGICSYHKATIGALESGMLPPPKTAVLSSHICDGGSAMARYLKERYGTEVYLLEVPYHDTPESRRLLQHRLASLSDFLMRKAGRAFGRGDLTNALRLSNQARENLVQANRLRADSILFRGYLALRNLFGLTFLLGSEEGVRAAKLYRRELEGRRAVPEQKNRLLWIHFAPLFAGELLRYFEKTCGCGIAFDLTGYIYWAPLDEEHPMRSLAQKVMSHFLLGNTGDRVRLYRQIIRKMHINAVVIFMHQGCRAIPGTSWEIQELCEKEGIPFLELYGDCIDPGGVSIQQMKLRMEAFAESPENRG